MGHRQPVLSCTIVLSRGALQFYLYIPSLPCSTSFKPLAHRVSTDLHYQYPLLAFDTARRTCSKHLNCLGSTTPYWRPLSKSTSPKPHRCSSSTRRQVRTLFVSCFLVSARPRNEICFLSSIEQMVCNLHQPCFRWSAKPIQGAR